MNNKKRQVETSTSVSDLVKPKESKIETSTSVSDLIKSKKSKIEASTSVSDLIKSKKSKTSVSDLIKSNSIKGICIHVIVFVVMARRLTFALKKVIQRIKVCGNQRVLGKIRKTLL